MSLALRRKNMVKLPMNSLQGNKKMRGLQASTRLVCCVILIQLFAAQIDAQESRSPWQTLNGESCCLFFFFFLLDFQENSTWSRDFFMMYSRSWDNHR